MKMSGVALLLAMLGAASAFAPAALRLPAETAGRVCAPRPALGLSMCISDEPTTTSRRQLLRGMSAVAVAAAVRINPVSAEDAASGGGLEGTTASGVKYKIIRETTAPGNKIGIVETAKKGDFVILTLKATGADGSVIMDTTQTGQGFAVDLGKGKTILGLEDGVEGMKAGETRILEIPAGPLTDPIKQDVKVEVTYERKSNLFKIFGGG